jgi:hypothetical protein
MSRSIRNETSSLAFGMVGRFGGSSAGFVVTALNAASAASNEVVGLRILSADILRPPLPLKVTLLRGDHQRRDTIGSLGVYIGLPGDQGLRHLQMATAPQGRTYIRSQAGEERMKWAKKPENRLEPAPQTP